MSVAKSYRDLEVWNKGMELSQKIYKSTEKFPKTEMYGLTSQIRRASISVPSNIAEGFMRYRSAEMVRFLQIALGSCGELDTQAELACMLGYLV